MIFSVTASHMLKHFSAYSLSALMLLAANAPARVFAQTQPDEVLTTQTPEKQFVTAASGPREAASAGSYAVRVYGARNPQFPTDDFITGIMRPRDGSLTRLDWRDVLNDGNKELVVVCISAGSGGYVSADALRLSGGKIVLVASVRGIDPKRDLVQALRAAARKKTL
jgi:hypothetical protein